VGDKTLVPFLLREPPPCPPATPLLSPSDVPPSNAAAMRQEGDWLACFLRGDAEVVPAVADFVPETAHGSISCSSLLMSHPLPLGFPARVSESGCRCVALSLFPSPPNPPRAKVCRKVPQPTFGLHLDLHARAGSPPARRDKVTPRLQGTSDGLGCDRPCHFLNSQGPGCLAIKHLVSALPIHYHMPKRPLPPQTSPLVTTSLSDLHRESMRGPPCL
jgi:hypothetical protein